jgi:hypothetical protein
MLKVVYRTQARISQKKGKDMSILRFTDGVQIETSGDYRIILLKDGYYIVGQGMCSPEPSLEAAQATLKQLKKEEESK